MMIVIRWWLRRRNQGEVDGLTRTTADVAPDCSVSVNANRISGLKRTSLTPE
jgi:hypothetical protein